MNTHRAANPMVEGTSGKIIELLRQGPQTIDDLAASLDLTRTAVRSQLTTLLGKRLAEPRGLRKGASKPARLFGLTAEAEQQLSRAYIPVLTQLLKRLSARLTPSEFETLMQEVGAGLGRYFPTRGSLRERVESANRILHELGGLTLVVEDPNGFTILGQGCPLSAVTAEFPQACGIVANLLAEAIGHPVTSCCERYDHRRCCFEISGAA